MARWPPPYEEQPNPASGTRIDRLVKVVDFAGREVKYAYDARGDLVAVTTPPVTGTSTGNDFPQGRTERYAYSSGFVDDRLNHNLVAVWSPEEVETGGPPTQTLTYGTSVANPLTFDRVLSETFGGTNASGIVAGGPRVFTYRAVNDDAPHHARVPRLEVTVTEPDGNIHVHLLDDHGEEIAVRVPTRGLRDGEPAYYETQKYYNKDGLLVRVIHPEGNEERYVYGSGSRAAQKNLVEQRQIAGPRGDGCGGAAEDLVTTFTYEPLFNRLASVTDARGHATSFVPALGQPSPERYTKRFYFDYQEDTTAVPEAVEFGIDLSSVQRGLGDLNGDGRVDQVAGNVVRTSAPSVTLAPESHEAQRLGSTEQPIVTDTWWNDRGQVTATIDPEGVVTELQYHPENDADGDGVATVSTLVTSAPRGYLRAVVADARNSPRRRTTTPPLGLTTKFSYDPVGNLVATTNARGVTTAYEVNQLNEVVSIIRGADIGEALFAGELSPNDAPLRYVSRSYYDFNGRVVRAEVEHRDGTNTSLGAFVERTFVYDILGAVVQTTAQVDVTTRLTTNFRYDPASRLVEVVAPEGNWTLTTYDERGLVHTLTRGAGTADASTITLDYDRNGNRVRVIDAEDTDGDGAAEATSFVLDGFDRPVAVVDALGNRALTAYDVASQVVRMQVIGQGPGAPPGAPAVLLADTRFHHDEAGRVFRSDAALFLSEGASPARPVLLHDHDGDGFVSSRVEFDALSRPWRRPRTTSRSRAARSTAWAA